MKAIREPGDRLPPRASFDARGRKAERLSEYFDFATWPDKAEKKVTRQELLALLTQRWLVEREMRWYRRLWRALTAKRGSGPQRVGVSDPDRDLCVCGRWRMDHYSGDKFIGANWDCAGFTKDK